MSDSNSWTEAELKVEADEKERKDLQTYLKAKGVKANGTTADLRSRYLVCRKRECGLVDNTELPMKKVASKKPKKKLSPWEYELKNDAEVGWQYSNAKAALKAAIMEKEVPLRPVENEDEDDLYAYFHCRPEVANHGEFEKFKSRLNALRDQIRNEMSRAEEDEEAFLIYVKNHPKATTSAMGNYPEWEGHAAQKLLQADMAQGYHLTMEPKELWLSEDEYVLFPLKVFRDHIHQETRTKKFLNFLKESDKAGHKWKDYRNPPKILEDSSDEEVA